jgi:glycosyltransferase involved in cell wall biosynthesis
MKQFKLCLVIPCFNEESILPETDKILNEYLDDLIRREKISGSSYLLYVDDGSKDSTWEMIKDAGYRTDKVRGIKLSTNFGHQNALLAGLLNLENDVDCCITLDADLQDDIHCIEEMLERHQEGCAIVYGVRSDRRSDSIIKRSMAQWFYKIMSLLGVKTIYNHADFRLLDKKVIHTVADFRESNLFLRGIIPSLGFKSAVVYYTRKPRTSGATKYPFKKQVRFAWEGITSFSVYPLRFIFWLGLSIFIASIALIIWALVTVFSEKAIPGWASTVIPLFLFSGLQMISVGILGEYIGKIYKEVKSRPRFIIEDKV